MSAAAAACQPGPSPHHDPQAPAPRGWIRPELGRLLREVLAHPGARRFRLHPARLISLRLGGSPPAEERLAAAERELARVHLLELAWLLREAARLRCGQEDGPDRDLRLEACRSGLGEALACAHADGLWLPRRAADLAREVFGAGVREWPPASRLARAALALDPCAVGRALLVRALQGEGDGSGASAVLASTLLSCRSRPSAVALLTELAGLQAGFGEAGRAQALRGWAVRVAREREGEPAQAIA